MKIKLIETGKVITVDESYGIRLYEQGKAVPVAEKKETISEKTEKEPKKKKE